MAGVIPKEQLAHVQRWEFNAFDGKPTAAARETPAPAPVVEAPPPPEDSVVVETVAEPTNLPTAEEIEALYDTARQEGYAAGHAEGLAAAEAESANQRAIEAERFSALFSNLQTALSTVDQQMAEELLQLALAVAAQVVRSNVAVNKAPMLPLIREAIQALPLHHGNIALHVNPGDAGFIQQHLGETFARSSTHIVPDTTVQPGGCLLKAGHSEIDATLETRWQRVVETLGVDAEQWLTPSNPN